AGVVPVHRQRPVVTDLVQSTDHRRPVDAAVARRAELPAGPRVAAGPVARQQPGAAVERQLCVLDVYMINPVGKAPQELDRVYTLPVQVARVEREPELLAAVEGIERQFRGIQIEREWPRVDLAGDPHAAVARRVEDRVPLPRKLLDGLGDHLLPRGGVAGDVAPDWRAGEPADDTGPELFGEAERRR